MVRTIGVELIDYEHEVYYFEFAGLSTDDKPTDKVATGSTFFETNTNKVYVFSEPSTWSEVT